MFKAQEGIGQRGEKVPGPPWILGHRGAPREAPENTQVSLRRALELGLDGVEYDLQRTATGEAVLLHDETLDRTTEATGPVGLRTLPELFGIDAGGWFHRSFEGEPLPLLEEVLELPAGAGGSAPQHMIEIKDPQLVREVARQLDGFGRKLSVRVASFHRSVCLEARDAGLPSMLLSEIATDEDLLFVRDEHIAAYGTGPGGWNTAAGERIWPCERWSWSVDEPEDLLEACRRPLNAFNTNEGLRALAVRALVHLCPGDTGAYPIQVSHLEVHPGSLEAARSEDGGESWSGRWKVPVRLRNPLPFRATLQAELWVRGGAFEVQGLPREFELGAGEECAFQFDLAGGSRSPGSDPLLAVRYRWREGPGRPAEELVLDAPLHRKRSVVAREETQRLPLLEEHRGDLPASMTLRRRGNQLLLGLENSSGLENVRVVARLGMGTWRGAHGLALSLPVDFDTRRDGIDFSCGIEGRDSAGRPRLRRFAGGIPAGLESGPPGLLLPRPKAPK